MRSSGTKHSKSSNRSNELSSTFLIEQELQALRSKNKDLITTNALIMQQLADKKKQALSAETELLSLQTQINMYKRDSIAYQGLLRKLQECLPYALGIADFFTKVETYVVEASSTVRINPNVPHSSKTEVITNLVKPRKVNGTELNLTPVISLPRIASPSRSSQVQDNRGEDTEPPIPENNEIVTVRTHVTTSPELDLDDSEQHLSVSIIRSELTTIPEEDSVTDDRNVASTSLATLQAQRHSTESDLSTMVNVSDLDSSDQGANFIPGGSSTHLIVNSTPFPNEVNYSTSSNNSPDVQNQTIASSAFFSTPQMSIIGDRVNNSVLDILVMHSNTTPEQRRLSTRTQSTRPNINNSTNNNTSPVSSDFKNTLTSLRQTPIAFVRLERDPYIEDSIQSSSLNKENESPNSFTPERHYTVAKRRLPLKSNIESSSPYLSDDPSRLTSDFPTPVIRLERIPNIEQHTLSMTGVNSVRKTTRSKTPNLEPKKRKPEERLEDSSDGSKSSVYSESLSTRPRRAAQPTSLKEPSLNKKMRRE